jgi:hypothetical protein
MTAVNTRVPGPYPMRDPDPEPPTLLAPARRITRIGDGIVALAGIVTGGVKLVYVPRGSVESVVLSPRV